MNLEAHQRKQMSGISNRNGMRKKWRGRGIPAVTVSSGPRSEDVCVCDLSAKRHPIVRTHFLRIEINVFSFDPSLACSSTAAGASERSGAAAVDAAAGEFEDDILSGAQYRRLLSLGRAGTT